MRTIKKTMGLALLTSTVLIGGYFTNTVYAGNIGDTSFSFALGNRIDPATESRAKYDATSAYMKVESINGQKTGDYFKAWIADSNGNDFSRRIEKSVDQAGVYELPNYAYEGRGSNVYVQIKTWSEYRLFYTWYANGKWSPDSIGF